MPLPSDKERSEGCIERLLVSGAGLGSFQRIQEVHGYVYHHCQSEGHIPTSGRHLTQVPSQVRFRGKNVCCELCIVTHRLYSSALPCARTAFTCTACSATAVDTKREHAQHKVSTHLDFGLRNGNLKPKLSNLPWLCLPFLGAGAVATSKQCCDNACLHAQPKLSQLV